MAPLTTGVERVMAEPEQTGEVAVIAGSAGRVPAPEFTTIELEVTEQFPASPLAVTV